MLIGDNLDERKKLRRLGRSMTNFCRSAMDLDGSVTDLDGSVIELDESVKMVMQISGGEVMEFGRLVRDLDGWFVAFIAGFSVLLSVLKEERDDVEMLEEDFYIRYYTLQLLTVFLTNSPNRLQEAILTIPRGITRLMDMLMDRKVQFKFKELSGAIGGTVEDLQELSGFSNPSPKQNVQYIYGHTYWIGVCSMSWNNLQKLRATSVLSHVLKDNMQCKERVLRIDFEEPTPSLGAPEPLLHCVVKYLALASCMKSKEGKLNVSGNTYVQAIILKLLVIWHSDCPSVVQCFLDSRLHLTSLLELVSNSTTTVDSGNDAFTIVDATSQKAGLTSYFLKFEEMQKSIIFSSAKPAEPRKPLTRSTAASMAEIEDVEENKASDMKNEDHPMLASMFDAQFVNFIKNLGADIRESIVDVYSHPKSNVAVVSAELQQKGWESDGDYVKRLKSFVEKQCSEITDFLSRNVTLAEDLAKIGRGGSSQSEHRSSGVQLETLHRDLQEASQRLDTLKTEKTKIESEASMYCNLAGKMESDLKSLSDAYNSLEQANFHLEKEIKALKSGGATPILGVEAVKAETREEAQKESEVELNDLLVEKLSVRLLELGEDIDKLLEGIDDDIGLLEDAEVEED
ncbi:hypothetical protein HYC85_022699 [Camellia sinensis]|uniref:Uso1/p115-like vesicle tethering protein C-terminal domain-containing protein n=1 Tax=Camellia sinensis TaxID=4442 RepID=A0A7J7GCJ7_CAMSI|nr:hypothetical protein HYC85_022699 [Camellia sinensis]